MNTRLWLLLAAASLIGACSDDAQKVTTSAPTITIAHAGGGLPQITSDGVELPTGPALIYLTPADADPTLYAWQSNEAQQVDGPTPMYTITTLEPVQGWDGHLRDTDDGLLRDLLADNATDQPVWIVTNGESVTATIDSPLTHRQLQALSDMPETNPGPPLSARG